MWPCQLFFKMTLPKRLQSLTCAIPSDLAKCPSKLDIWQLLSGVTLPRVFQMSKLDICCRFSCQASSFKCVPFFLMDQLAPWVLGSFIAGWLSRGFSTSVPCKRECNCHTTSPSDQGGGVNTWILLISLLGLIVVFSNAALAFRFSILILWQGARAQQGILNRSPTQEQREPRVDCSWLINDACDTEYMIATPDFHV